LLVAPGSCTFCLFNYLNPLFWFIGERFVNIKNWDSQTNLGLCLALIAALAAASMPASASILRM
jgi:hypothetical protein